MIQAADGVPAQPNAAVRQKVVTAVWGTQPAMSPAQLDLQPRAAMFQDSEFGPLFQWLGEGRVVALGIPLRATTSAWTTTPCSSRSKRYQS